MSFLIEILILLYLCLISCQNPNSTEKAINNTNEAKEQIPNLDDILNAPEELRNQTLEHTFSHYIFPQKKVSHNTSSLTIPNLFFCLKFAVPNIV